MASSFELSPLPLSIARVETERVGAERLVVSWSWKGGQAKGKVIPDLYLQVVPAMATEGERREVVDDIFSHLDLEDSTGSDDGQFEPSHTSGNGQLVRFSVSEREQGNRRKRVRLAPNCTYEISLGVVTSERYVQRSNVSRARLGFVVLCAEGSGDLSRSRQRRVRLGGSRLLCHLTEADPKSGRAYRALGVSDVSRATARAAWGPCKADKADASDSKLTEDWASTPGLNVTALDLRSLEPVYSRCFRTYDLKDDFASSAAVADLHMELSGVGEISRIAGDPKTRHLWVITTTSGWEVRAEHKQLGELLSGLLSRLGCREGDAGRVREAAMASRSASGRGCRPLAFVGATPISSTYALHLPEFAKGAYNVASCEVCLSFDGDFWFPSFKRHGGKSGRWEVWQAPSTHHTGDGEGGSGNRLRRTETAKEVRLRRNHVVIRELEDICRHFSGKGGADAAEGADFDLTVFLHIVFDAISGYTHGPDGPELASQDDFLGVVASLSSELEQVLARLLETFPIAGQLVEAGAVEFLVSRINLSYGPPHHASLSSSLWLLASLALGGDASAPVHDRRTKSSSSSNSNNKNKNKKSNNKKNNANACATGGSPLLMEYSSRAQPRLLAEVHRRGGVIAASVNLERCWEEAAMSGDLRTLRRLAVLMLHAAEMGAPLVRAIFALKGGGQFAVNTLQTRLPIKGGRDAPLHPRGGVPVVWARPKLSKNDFEPEKVGSWGPGWAGSGELLAFPEERGALFEGRVVLVPPAETFAEHAAIVLQSCRLVWLAGRAGAAAVIFVWPGPCCQMIHPNLNFAHQTEIPSYVMPSSADLDEILSSSESVATVDMLSLYSVRDSGQALDFEVFASPKGVPEAAARIGRDFTSCLRQILSQSPKIRGERPLRVLSLDGGGVKGIGTICMLKEILSGIQEEEGRAPDPGRTVASYFDLVVGTSAGGIIAMALANGMGLGDIEAFYNKSVHEIFSSKDTYWEQLQRGPGASAARRLQEIIKTDWPNRTPTSCPADSPACAFPFRHPPEADLPACCVVTTLVSRDPSRTCLLKSYQSNADASVPYLPAVHRATILQCIRATSAAPYYLEEALCHADVCTGEFYPEDKLAPKEASRERGFHLDPVVTAYRFVDGAITTNNPTCASIIEAKALYPNRPLVVVSLGTGNGLAKVPVKTYPSGIGVVLQNLITSVSDVSLADSFAAHMLGREDRYYRFCPTADVFNCDMGISDEAVLSEIRSESKAYMANPSVRAKLVDLAKILAGPRT